MIKITTDELKEIKGIRETVIRKLNAALDGTGEMGKMVNLEGPLLCRESIAEMEVLRVILEKAEDVAARAGDLEDERKAEAEATQPVELAAVTEEKPPAEEQTTGSADTETSST